MEELLLEFIRQKSPKINITKILGFKVRECFECNESDGKHYLVNCLISIPDHHFTTEQYIDIGSQCLVNIKAFKRWRKEQAVVEWI